MTSLSCGSLLDKKKLCTTLNEGKKFGWILYISVCNDEGGTYEEKINKNPL